MAKFFKYLFAQDGDKTTVPETTQPSGDVSYQEGWGFDYQRDYPSDPDAKTIPRDAMNELLYQITLALQQYQTLGFPDFITTSDNGGTPYSYTKNATVRYDDGVNGFRNYYSLIDANTSLPSDTTQWGLVVYTTGEETGVVKEYWGSTLPTGYCWANGQTIGSAASGATGRANADTATLYSLLWTATSNAVFPIQNSSGVATTRGISAAADFAANKRFPLPDRREVVAIGKGDMGGTSVRGLVTAAVSGINPATLGGSGGLQAVALTANQNGQHSHTATTAADGGHTHTATTASNGAHVHAVTNDAAGVHTHALSMDAAGVHTHVPTLGNAGTHIHTGTTNTTGAHVHGVNAALLGGAGIPLVNVAAAASTSTAGWTYTTTSAGDHAHTLNVVSNGDHTHSLSLASAGSHTHALDITSAGEHTHTTSVSSNGAHTHTVTVVAAGTHTHAVTVENSGTGAVHQNMQPTLVCNFIIKL